MSSKKKLLVLIASYGTEQLKYLEQLITEFKEFKKYEVRIVVNTNIPLNITGIDKVNVIKLDDYQLLPLTCRKVIWESKDDYDYFIYNENDHLFLEKHLDKHIEYSKILPKDRICGLIRYEEDKTGKYYPDYHLHFDWNYKSVETHGGKVFAHFNNIHQGSFILTKEQLLRAGNKIDFVNLVDDKDSKQAKFIKKVVRKMTKIDLLNKEEYSVKCKVNTDIYQYAGMKKLICISEFEDNLIHHLPNLYIKGSEGRRKLRSDSVKMENAVRELLKE